MTTQPDPTSSPTLSADALAVIAPDVVSRMRDAGAAYCPHHGEHRAFEFRAAHGAWIPVGCPHCNIAALGVNKPRSPTERAAAALTRAGVPERYVVSPWDRWTEPTTPGGSHIPAARDALAIVTRYVSKFARVRAAGTCMLFVGGVGTGKTLLACGVLERVILAGFTGRFTTARDLVRDIRSTWNRSAEAARFTTERAAIAHFARPDLLVIDDVGAQAGTDSEALTLFDVIDERYSNQRPTLLTSNLTLAELQHALGERTVDRLGDRAVIVPFEWASHRKARP